MNLPSPRLRMLGPAVLILIVAAIIGGAVASYRLSQSAERQSNIAINTFDLHGDLRQIAGYLSLTRADRTTAVESDISSAIAGGRQAIGGLRAEGPLSPLLVRAINESTTYLDFAQRSIVSTHAATATTESSVSVAAADAVGDLVDRAASQAEQSAHREALDGRIGGIVVLLLVVAFVGMGLLWIARQHRREAMSATLAKERERFEAMIEHSSDLFFLTGDDNRMKYCSPSAARFFGMSAVEVCAAPFEQFVHSDDLGQVSDAFIMAHATGAVGPLDIRVRHGDGGWRTLEVTADDLSLVSEIQGIAWHTRDVTDRRALEEQLSRQAFEDSLTGLANRALFRDRLGHALVRGGRTHATVAVLMIDLDGFKAINDSMGHDAGDHALKEIAARIARSARPGDTIARLGGDEFAVLLEGLGDLSFAHEVANRILDLVRQPFMVDETSVRVSASIGIAVSGTPDCTPETLLRDSDTAMYAAKASGRDRSARFDPAMHARATKLLRFSQDLGRALENRELVVYYQPSIGLAHAKLEGVEALLRWRHSELGLLSPDLFIPIAEQNGLIVPIGRWVLEQACEQAVIWRAGLPPENSFVVEVNVSGRQLNHESFIPDVRSILTSSGLAPESLVLEISETVLMSDIDLVIARLRELKELGVAIAIDDFGTGFSSLAYLGQLPIDILKIDKSFVKAAAAGDPGGDAILRAILDLSAGLHLRTIAEGIEDVSQAQHVKDLGCQSAQGFLYSRPMLPGELSGRLAANDWGTESMKKAID